MNNSFNLRYLSLKIMQHLLLIFLSLALTSCFLLSPKREDFSEIERVDSKLRFEQVLRDAKKKSGVQSFNMQILAADMARAQKYPARAQEILDDLFKQKMPSVQQVYATIVAADLALGRKQPREAVRLLSQPVTSNAVKLPVKYQTRLHLLKATALQQVNQPIAAIKERVFVSSLLENAQVFDNNTQIWQMLSQMPSSKMRKTGDQELDAWFDLATNFKKAESVRQQQQILTSWRKKNSKHPAAKILPEALAKLPIFADTKIRNIALVLPQSGKTVDIANSIKHGFMSAYYASLDAGAVPLQIEVYDEALLNSLTVGEFYQRLESDGIQVVVGPFDKANVSKLAARTTLPLATLALNYGDDWLKPPQNLFQFGLRPEDEAREVALKAYADGHKSAIALVPNTVWGDRMLKEFKSRWNELGGILLAYERFDRPANLSNQIADVLQVEKSAARANKLKKVLGAGSFEFSPTSRQDVDFIFLAADPKQAQLIKPLLNYHHAKDLPVYATSAINADELTAAQYADVANIVFCDAPWILKSNTPLRHKVGQYWPDASGNVGRLYAMGADAYNLLQSLEQMQEARHLHFEGLSGILEMDNSGRVQRRLVWGQFTGLQVKLLDDSAQ